MHWIISAIDVTDVIDVIDAINLMSLFFNARQNNYCFSYNQNSATASTHTAVSN